MRRRADDFAGWVIVVIMLIVSILLFSWAFGAGEAADRVEMSAETTATGAIPVPSTSTSVPKPEIEAIAAPADAIETVARVDPPPTTTIDPCNHAGLDCRPFYPGDPADKCAELNFYRIEWGIPDGWGDQPRTGPKRSWGRGWRESNCDNTANSHHSAGCCFGWWQVASSNITAPGYAAAGVFSNCGVASKWDYWGDDPLAKQRNACIVANLIAYHLARGEDPGWVVWDQWL